MKKLSSIITLFFAFVMSLTLFACSNDKDNKKDPVAESISVSGQKTLFYVGDAFSSEGLVVTIKYDNATDRVATTDEYTVDSSAYVATTVGNYTITVKLNDTDLETSYSVVVDDRMYPVTADNGVTFTEGVTEGKTKAGRTINFTAVAEKGKHITAVKVNGTVVVAEEGVYSFSSSDYIENNDSVIAVSLEQEAHNYEATVTAPKCQLEGYTTYTCACGDSYTGNTVEARFLYSDLDKWTSGVKLELVNHTAKYTMTTDDGWSVAYRNVNLTTTDYIRFAGVGKFKVELKAKDETIGTVLIAEQEMNGKVFVVPVSEVVSEDGEYILSVYAVGARDSEHIVTECYALTSENEDVHKFGEWNETEDEKTRECEICAVKESVAKFSVTFDKANGTDNEVKKILAGETVTAITAPVKTGYVFAGWYNGENEFDFDTIIEESITLVAHWNPATDTHYSIEYYEQQEDGTYRLIDTWNYTGTTDTNVTAVTEGEGAYVPTSQWLYFNADHEENELAGVIAADGSLILKVFYSYKEVTVYSLAALNGKASALEVSFAAGSVNDGDKAMLDIRNPENETVNKVWATVTANIVSFAIENIDLTDKLAVISVNGKTPQIAAVKAIGVVAATANVSELRHNNVIDAGNGILVYGPESSDERWLANHGFNGSTTIQVFYKDSENNDKDYTYATVKMSALSGCGAYGADSITLSNATETLEKLDMTRFYFMEQSKTLTYTKEKLGNYLNFALSVQCGLAWGICQSGHPTEWARIDNVTFYNDVALTAETILATNGVVAKYIAPVAHTVYGSEFYGVLKQVNVAVEGAENGTSVSLTIYKNGVKVKENISATVANGLVVYDATELNLYGNVQVEVIGDVTVTGVSFDTIDSFDAGKALYNNAVPTDYRGGMTIQLSYDSYASVKFDENGRMYISKGGYSSWNNLGLLNYSAIKDNVTKLSITTKGYRGCSCNGATDMIPYILCTSPVMFADGMFAQYFDGLEMKKACLISADNLNNEVTEVCEFGQTNARNACSVYIRSAFGCNGADALEHNKNRYMDISDVTAELNYVGTQTTLNF